MIYQIAIDGPTASGKGSAAKMLARKFGFLCLDTGAIYRGITVYFLDNHVDVSDPVSYNRALGEVDIDIQCVEGDTFIFLSGQNITERIRTNTVSTIVPSIARLPEVRAKVREIQKRVGSSATLVCEGRDITSVVFPSALFKFYLTADARARAIRRQAQLKEKGEDVSLEILIEQINIRDKTDMTREKSPLVCVDDAIKIDATRKTVYDVVKQMERIVTRKLRKLSD